MSTWNIRQVTGGNFERRYINEISDTGSFFLMSQVNRKFLQRRNWLVQELHEAYFRILSLREKNSIARQKGGKVKKFRYVNVNQMLYVVIWT